MIHRAGQTQPRIECRLKGRGGLECIYLEGVEGGKRFLGRVAPEQFRPLSFGQFQMRFRQSIEDVGRTVAAQLLAFAADEPITKADEIITHVDRGADAVLPVQRRPAVAKGVVVLDVVVNQGRLVKRFDGQGGAPDRVRQRHFGCRVGAGGALQRVVGGERDEGPRPLAALGQPIVGDALMRGERVAAGMTVAGDRRFGACAGRQPA